MSPSFTLIEIARVLFKRDFLTVVKNKSKNSLHAVNLVAFHKL